MSDIMPIKRQRCAQPHTKHQDMFVQPSKKKKIVWERIVHIHKNKPRRSSLDDDNFHLFETKQSFTPTAHDHQGCLSPYKQSRQQLLDNPRRLLLLKATLAGQESPLSF